MIKNEEIYYENISDLIDECEADIGDVKLVFKRLSRTLYNNNNNEMIRIDANYFGEMVAENIKHLQQIQENLDGIADELTKAKEEGYADVDGCALNFAEI